jgi:hypothetical protein
VSETETESAATRIRRGRRKRGGPRLPGDVRRNLRLIWPACIEAWRACKDAEQAREDWIAEHPELCKLWQAELEATARSNECGLALDALMRELMEAAPEQGEQLRAALAAGNLERAKEVIGL